jgi:1-acyl-sn-glycerol-3-phosphate acyltransferase
VENGEKFPPICIFPEGGTSNSRYLLSFKKGAFIGE